MPPAVSYESKLYFNRTYNGMALYGHASPDVVSEQIYRVCVHMMCTFEQKLKLL